MKQWLNNKTIQTSHGHFGHVVSEALIGETMSCTHVNLSNRKPCIPVLSEVKHKHHQPVRPDAPLTRTVSRFLTDRKKCRFQN